MRFQIRMLISQIRVSYTTFRFSSSVVENLAFGDVISDLKATEKMSKRFKAPENISQFLLKCFDKNDKYAYNFIVHAFERSEPQENITFAILKIFNEWFKTHKETFPLTTNEKSHILHAVLKHKKYSYAKLIFNALYDSTDSQFFIAFAEELVKENKFSQAAIIIKLLKLQEKFSLEEVIYPLVFENETNLVELYLKDHPHLQLELAKKLDALLGDSYNSNLPENLSSHLNHRRIFKLLSHVINVHKIPAVECKNLHFIRSKGALRVLVHKKPSVPEENWEDMIMNIVGDNEKLRRHLVILLAKRNNKETALKMAKKFCFTEDQLPKSLFDFENETLKSEDLTEDGVNENLETVLNLDENEGNIDNNESKYLKFQLNFSSIKFVTTKEEFNNCISEITQNYEIIGIDSEWKPNFGLSEDRLSLVQLSGHDKAFVLDILALKECLDGSDWDRLMDEVFGNQQIIKLGYGLITDVQMLIDAKIGSKGKTVKFAYLLDLGILYRKLQDVYPIEMTYEDTSTEKGLSQLCNIFLGKPLNKETQICDWEKRPLTQCQLEYATLDAHCLLKIYDKLKEEAIRRNVNFEHIVKVSIVITASLWKPKKKTKGIRGDQELNVTLPTSITDFKVAVEPNLSNIVQKLRKFGTDAVDLKSQNTVYHAEKMVKMEKRIIVCSELLGKSLKNRVSLASIFVITEEDDVQEVIPRIFLKYNIQMDTKSMFTRCTACNSVQIKNVPLQDLITLHENSQSDKWNEDCETMKNINEELKLTFSEMFKSGISIKFDKFTIEQLNGIENASLCTNCGTVHCYTL